MAAEYIGIDVGGTKCAVIRGKVGQGIEIEEKIRFETKSWMGPQYALDGIFVGVDKLWTARVQAIGVSCGGPLDADKGVVLSPPNLPGWNTVPITDMLGERFGVPAYLQNDADASAVAEWKFGAGRGTDNMVFFTFGTGLGAGLILNGRLYTGANGMAGEAGHIRLAGTGPVGYGKAGSFEGFCSGGGIAQMAREKMRAGADFGVPSQSVSAKEVMEAARAGMPEAVEIVETCGKQLGRGLAVVIDILNPEKIVIGGIYPRARDLLEPQLSETLKEEALELSCRGCEILPAALGEQIGDYAALAAAMREKWA